MSWLRSAVNRAVEVGGSSHITRAVRGYADSVVCQAMVGGAKFFQDRLGARSSQNFKLAVKRLEEVSVSCRGIERVQLLRRWLEALQETERINEMQTSRFNGDSDEKNLLIPESSVVLYYDRDLGEQPMKFRDIFLHSQALEGITLSLILEEPNDEELSLLMEIFCVCLLGGKEVTDVTVASVRDMAIAFSIYSEEVLARREELLQYAQVAIAGLKASAEIERIDSEVSIIRKQLEDKKRWLLPEETSTHKHDNSSGLSVENLKEAVEYFRLCSQLEELLLMKKRIQRGDPPEARHDKVDKLKVLSESLSTSTSKAEKRISELRVQKEEALKFRVAKTSEVTQLQKDFTAEINALERRKSELEEELRKVTIALTSANARLRNVREERDQFDEASNQIIQHIKLKDDELSKSIMLYRAEEKVCRSFFRFLESTWNFQVLNTKQKEKLVNDELERHHKSFVNLAVGLLGAYKEEFRTYISLTIQLVGKLRRLDESPTEEGTEAVKSRKLSIEKYLDTETKVEAILSLVSSIKKQISKQLKDFRLDQDEARVVGLLDELEKMMADFDSLEKPDLRDEMPLLKPRTPRISFLSNIQLTPKEKLEAEPAASTPATEPRRGIVSPFSPILSLPLMRSRSTVVPTETTQLQHIEALGPVVDHKFSNAEAQLSKLKLELELESHSRGSSMDGLFDWEFDEKVEKTIKSV